MAVVRDTSRRERILDEAFNQMGGCGYRALSLAAVAARCGVTKQGLMHHFPTKGKLLVAVLNERDASIEADLLQQLSDGGFEKASGRDAKRDIFRKSLTRVVDHMLDTPDLIRLHVVLRAEAIDPRHPAHAFFRRRDDATLRWLAERTALFTSHPLSKARQILGLLLGLQSQWLQEKQGFNILDEWKRGLSALLH